jgi:prophage maintenance system killer protein
VAEPPFENLTNELQLELAEASAAVQGLTEITPGSIDTAPDENFSKLRHELSAHYLALNPTVPHDSRSRLEAEVLEEFENRPEPLPLLSASGFRDRLVALNLILTDGGGGWRAGPVRLRDDRAGNRIFFPHASVVPGQIDRVRLLLAGQGRTPPLFKAAVAYVLLLNCHPFNDGNGRTARVLFNHLLRRAGMSGNVYFPLYEIALRAHGGYQIALRMAELRRDWTPFLSWLLDAFSCCRAIAENKRG